MPARVVRLEGWLTLLLPLESREFQASPLLLPVPTQVPQPAARAASLLEHHAIQLCQHTGRECAGDEDWGHRTSRLPAQVLLGAWPPLMRLLLPAAPISSPFSPRPLSFPHFVLFFHCFLCVQLPGSLPERTLEPESQSSHKSVWPLGASVSCSETWVVMLMLLSS